MSSIKTPHLLYENQLYAQGYKCVGGVDEAGRGPLAGPVVACAVVLPRDCIINGVRDSKKLSPSRRTQLADLIYQAAIAWHVSIVDEATIDRINILQATLLAMAQAVEKLAVTPDALLIDGPHSPVCRLYGHTHTVHTVPLPHGDAISHSIAAASIVAKVTRDALMEDIHQQYPQYGFDKHKGYGTPQHIAALRAHGSCPRHRATFIKRFV